MLCHCHFAYRLFFSVCFYSSFSVFLLSGWEFTSFLCSLLFKAVFLFVEVSLCAVGRPLIVASLVVSVSFWLVVEVVCCVTDASLFYTHTRPEIFPIQEVRALQLHFRRFFGHLSFVINCTFSFLFQVQSFPSLETC